MPTASFEEFAGTVSGGSLKVHLEATELPEPLAGIMWTMMNWANKGVSCKRLVNQGTRIRALATSLLL